MPGRLEDSKAVDASIEAPKNLLADEPGHLTVVEAEADQLRSRQDSGLALRPCDCAGRQRFNVMHRVSLRTGSPIVRTSPDLWKPVPEPLWTSQAAFTGVRSLVFGRRYAHGLD